MTASDVPTEPGSAGDMTVEPLVSAGQMQAMYWGHHPGDGFWARWAAEVNAAHAAVVERLLDQSEARLLAYRAVVRQRDAARAVAERLGAQKAAVLALCRKLEGTGHLVAQGFSAEFRRALGDDRD